MTGAGVAFESPLKIAVFWREKVKRPKQVQTMATEGLLFHSTISDSTVSDGSTITDGQPAIKIEQMFDPTPVEPEKARTGRRTIWPFDNLTVGSGFFVRGRVDCDKVRRAVYRYRKSHGKDIRTTTEIIGEKETMRVFLASDARIETSTNEKGLRSGGGKKQAKGKSRVPLPSPGPVHTINTLDVPITPPNPVPTKEQFLQYIATVEVGQSFKLGADLRERWPELHCYAQEFARLADQGWSFELGDTNFELKRLK